MEHVNSSINKPQPREKFRLMSTVWFILQKPITSIWRYTEVASWRELCVKIFGFNETEIHAARSHVTQPQLLCDPPIYDVYSKRSDALGGTMYRLLDETKRLIPEPILSHRVASIAHSCMRFLHCPDPNNPPLQDNLLSAWAMQSKQLPWLWRQRTRVTSIALRQPTWDYDRPKYSFSWSLR